MEAEERSKEPLSDNTAEKEPFVELGATVITTLVDEWVIGELNAERNRYVIKRRLIDGIPYKDLESEIEGKYGIYLSSKQLGRIVGKGIKTIKKHMG